jgi:hypothetical protein
MNQKHQFGALENRSGETAYHFGFPHAEELSPHPEFSRHTMVAATAILHEVSPAFQYDARLQFPSGEGDDTPAAVTVEAKQKGTEP